MDWGLSYRCLRKHAWALTAAAALALPVGVRAQQTVTFQDGVSPTPTYAGTRDVSLTDAGANDTMFSPTTNYDSSDNVCDGDPIDKAVLLSWDLSSVPTTAQIVRARVDLTITSESASEYFIHELLRPWNASEATWLRASTSVPWSAGGAQGSTDKNPQVLGRITPTTAGALEMVALNDAGVALVQRWIRFPLANVGVWLGDYSENAADGFHFGSSKSTPVDSRPRLHIEFVDGGTTAFRNGLSPTAAYNGQVDTTIAYGPTPQGNWNAPLLYVGEYPHFTTLLAFDLSSIPVDVKVQSASLGLTVWVPPSLPITLREVMKPWSETDSTWATTNGATPWARGGADGPSDLGAVDLATIAGSIPAGTTTVVLNPAGIAVINDWVSRKRPNHGFRLANFDNGQRLIFSSREAETPSARPSLTLVGALPDGGAFTLGAVSNSLPVARLEPAEATGRVGEVLNLSAAASTASPGAAVTAYRWSLVQGPSGTSFTEGATQALKLPSDGDYVVRLVVEDSLGKVSEPVTSTLHIGTVVAPRNEPLGCGCHASPSSLALLALVWKLRRRCL